MDCRCCNFIELHIESIILQLLKQIDNTTNSFCFQDETFVEKSIEEQLSEFKILRKTIATFCILVEGYLPDEFNEIIPLVGINDCPKYHFVGCPIKTLALESPYCASTLLQYKYGASEITRQLLEQRVKKYQKDLVISVRTFYFSFVKHWRTKLHGEFQLDPHFHFVLHETFTVAIYHTWRTFCGENSEEEEEGQGGAEENGEGEGGDVQMREEKCGNSSLNRCEIGPLIFQAYNTAIAQNLLTELPPSYLVILLYSWTASDDDFWTASDNITHSSDDGVKENHGSVFMGNDSDAYGYGDDNQASEENDYCSGNVKAELENLLASIKEHLCQSSTDELSTPIIEQFVDEYKMLSSLNILTKSILCNFHQIFPDVTDLCEDLNKFGTNIYNKLQLVPESTDSAIKAKFRTKNDNIRKAVNAFVFDLSRELVVSIYNGNLFFSNTSQVVRLYSALQDNTKRRNKISPGRLCSMRDEQYILFSGSFKRPRDGSICGTSGRHVESDGSSKRIAFTSPDEYDQPASINPETGSSKVEFTSSRLRKDDSSPVSESDNEKSLGTVILRHGLSVIIYQRSFYDLLCKADEESISYIRSCSENLQEHSKVFQMYRWNVRCRTLSGREVAGIIEDVKLFLPSASYIANISLNNTWDLAEQNNFILEQDYNYKAALEFVSNKAIVRKLEY